MRRSSVNFFRRIFKFLLVTVGSLLLIPLLILLLLQIPYFQKFASSKLSAFLSKKAGSEIKFKSIGIQWNRIIANDVLIRSAKKDTIIYAARLEAGIDLLKLLHKQIEISEISLHEADAHLIRTKGDSIFNYAKLFADTNAIPQKSKSVNGFSFNLSGLNFEKTKFKYIDQPGGINLDLNATILKADLRYMDAKNMIFSFGRLLGTGINCRLIISQAEKKAPVKENTPSLQLLCNLAGLSNCQLKITDSVNHAVYNLNTLHILASNFVLSPDRQFTSANSLWSQNTSFAYLTRRAKDSTEHAPANEKSWMVKINEVRFYENKLAVHLNDKEYHAEHFNAQHIQIDSIRLRAENFFYNGNYISCVIHHAAAMDSVDFQLKDLTGSFKYKNDTLSAKLVSLKTGYSESVRSEIEINYISSKSYSIAAGLLNCRVNNHDILYFAPDLKNQVFLCDPYNSSTISGKFRITEKEIFAFRSDISSAKTSRLKGEIYLKNYFNPDKIFVRLEKVRLESSALDFQTLGFNRFIPHSFNLPVNFSLSSDFEGTVKQFETVSQLASDKGSAGIEGKIDSAENFHGNAYLSNLNLRYLIGSKSLPASLTATSSIKGHGLDTNNFYAEIDAGIPSMFYQNYNWQNISIHSDLKYREFRGNISLKDPNADFYSEGFISLKKGQEQYQLKTQLKGADLQALKISKKDYKLAFSSNVDLKGSNMYNVNGHGAVYGIIVSFNEQPYLIDSVLFMAVNEEGKNEMNLRSPIVSLKYKGTFAPIDLAREMNAYFSNLFPAFTKPSDSLVLRQKFDLSLQVHQHPLLSGAIFPKLKAFESLDLESSYDGPSKKMDLNLKLPKFTYDEFDINELELKANASSEKFEYDLSSPLLARQNIQLENFKLNGKIADKELSAHFFSADDKKNTKLDMTIIAEAGLNEVKLKLKPDPFILMKEQWQVSDDNYLLFHKKDFMVHHLELSKDQSKLSIESLHDRFDDDLLISLKDFDPAHVSRILSGDSAWVEGHINGDILFKRKQNEKGFLADIKISGLKCNNTNIGELELKAVRATESTYSLSMNLKGENQLNLSGAFKSDENVSGHLEGKIEKLSVKSLTSFFPRKFKESEGSINGHFTVAGRMNDPKVNALLHFDNAYTNPLALNSRLHIDDQNISVKDNSAEFNNFKITDKNQKEAVLNGKVKISRSVSQLAFSVNTNSFLIMNTGRADDKEFYGQFYADSKMQVKGNLNSPVVNASIRIKNHSNITFAVPEQMVSADRGEGVVEFNDSLKLNPILLRNKKKKTEKTDWKNFNINCALEFERKASLRFLIDPVNHDSLVVRGEGELNATIDPGGRITLTGLYNISDGTYMASMENLIKRNFIVEPGSSVTWNGDPLDANIYINAHHIVRTTAIDLVAGQIPDQEADEFRKRHAFQIDMKLRGALLSPQITFGIHLAQGESNLSSGMLNAKLEQLNENPSSLNKQVISLLVLNRFTQENPLSTETNPAETAARTTVGKFLSAQLNQMSSKLLPGFDVNFDVQSFEEYSGGKSQGRTQVGLGVSKQLFNERLNVQLGGAVDVEGQRAGLHAASDIAGDISVEYKLSADGTYRIKAFRNNQYAGIIEGQITETGSGFIYVKDFEKWRHLFRKKKRK